MENRVDRTLRDAEPDLKPGKRARPLGRITLERVLALGCRVCAYAVAAALIVVLAWLLWHGLPRLVTSHAPFINWEFIFGTQEATSPSSASGDSKAAAAQARPAILPCIAGTVLLTLCAAVASLCVGIPAAIYLSEFTRRGGASELLRLAIRNLAGVPPVVIGLFVLAIASVLPGWFPWLVTAWATLTLLALPIIIAASEEALRAVPKGAINAALALGASRLQMIRTVRVPMALPGILTSCLLAVGQVAGETAPLLITAVYAGQHGGSDGGVSPFVGLLTLPSHIYMLSVGETQDFGTYSEQAATALLYLGLVFVFGIGTVIARSKLRQQILQRA